MNFSPRTRRGPPAPNAALSWREVTQIRNLAERGWSARQIKATLELRCSEQTVRRVIIAETYRNEAA